MGFDLGSLNPLKAITDTVGKVIDRVVPDKAANDAAKNELAKMALSGELAQVTAQTDINKIEAASPNLFVSGWRPSIGWVCSASLAYDYLVRPIATGIATMIGHPAEFPPLDMGTLVSLLFALLGLSTQRTVEKINKAEGNRS